MALFKGNYKHTVYKLLPHFSVTFNYANRKRYKTWKEVAEDS